MRRLILLLLAAGCAASVVNEERTARRSEVSSPPDGSPELVCEEGPLELTSISEETSVANGLATTLLDLVFKNDQQRALEGELLVPLPEGASLTSFALEVNGQLHEGALVERERARVAFESVERRGVDPGLVEWSHGNTFRARVFPIPAHGTKRAVLRFEQEARSRLVIDLGPRVTGTLSLGGSVTSFRGKVDLPLPADGPEGWIDERGAFFARVPIGAPPELLLPRRVTVLYDAGLSALARDRKKECEVLARVLDGVEPRLVTFAHQVLSVEDCATKEELIARIDATAVDGVSRLGCLDLEKLQAGTDAFLLVSDGIAAFGSQAVPSRKRTVCLASGPTPDLVALARLGRVVSLRELDVETATRRVRALPRKPRVDGALELFPGDLESDVISIAGRLAPGAKEAWLHVPQGAKEWSFSVPLAPAEGASRLLARRKIERLLEASAVDVAAVVSLAKAERVVTPYTSFVVLETLDDYRRYGIEDSPVGYNFTSRSGDPNQRAATLAETRRRESLQDAAKQQSSFDAAERRRYARIRGVDVNQTGVIPVEQPLREPGAVSYTAVQAQYLENAHARLKELLEEETLRREVSEGQVARLTQSRRSLDQEHADLVRLISVASGPTPRDRPAGIATLASASELDPTYFKVRDLDAVFFAEAADLYVARGQRARALRVLTNLAALDPGNPALLRVLAYRLEEMSEPALALEVLARVLELRPEEPQSLRDLALLQADTGNIGSAVALLRRIEEGCWDGRFPEIGKIAARERARLEDPASVRADLRVVLTWDADAVDVDLWVTEPSGEKVFYSHPLSKSGGRLSRDFTQGYGPEEFVLEHAPKGDYLIEADFYGDRRQTRATDTTIQGVIFTGYGSSVEERRVVVRRMSEKKGVVSIGRVSVP